VPDATAAGRNAAGFNGTAYDAVGLDERRFRHALGSFATGVVVISTGSGNRLHAMTANAFMSGSLKPPLIVVSVDHRARMHDRHPCGDHTLFVGEVLVVSLNEHAPLIFLVDATLR
jgi:flavin reductase (DIM6/NTAB) family NADH-FMN oxidoreductase RutF